MIVVGTHINLEVCQTLNATKGRRLGYHHSGLRGFTVIHTYPMQSHQNVMPKTSTTNIKSPIRCPLFIIDHQTVPPIPSIRNNYHLPSSISTNLVNKIIINSSRFAKTHSHVHILLSLLDFVYQFQVRMSLFGGCFCLQSIASLSLAAASLAFRQIIKLN